MSMLFYFIFFVLTKGSISLTVSTPFAINVSVGINSSIVLNCTYKDETSDNIYSMTWFKKEPNKDKILANFDPNGVFCGVHDLTNRSSCTGYGPNSSSAIIHINDIRCEDDGDYKCVVVNKAFQNEHNSTTVYVQVEAGIPTEFTMQPNNSLAENDVVNFFCSANVGNPEGLLRIWKQRNDLKELLGESSVSDNRMENCTTFAHLTLNYNLSRHDQGAKFWCSSQNKITVVPARSREIGPVGIFYGLSNVSIAISPDKASVYVGDRVRLTCTSDGNPRPKFQWTFNSTNIVDGEKYHLLDDNATIEFKINNITDSGYYHCFASNTINGKPSNMSVNVTLRIQEMTVSPPEAANSCSAIFCSFFEICSEKNDTAICSIDVWKLIAFVFIAVTLVLGMTTIRLCLSWRFSKRELGQISSGGTMSDVLISKSPVKFEDFGGYADPKDVKRPETNIKSDNDGRDNPYADPLDTKTLYTFIQKNYENPVKSSSPSDTTLQSLANSQGPDSTCNHVNSSSPGDVSDNCPKPPNVYDDAWV